MQLADLLIVCFLLVSVITAFAKGFVVEVISLAGVLAGFVIAAQQYGSISPWIAQFVHSQPVANLVAFLLIEFLVAVLAAILGRVIRALVQKVGLGFFDRVFGALFGFARGCVIVTLVVMGVAAFLPKSTWLRESRLAPAFLTAAHQAALVTPADLEKKIREGVRQIRAGDPHPLGAATL